MAGLANTIQGIQRISERHTMKAIVVQENKTVKVEERPTPSLKQNQILLKTRTVGINPTGTLEPYVRHEYTYI